MSSKFYYEAEKVAKETAAECEITDSLKVREMTCENLKSLMVQEGQELTEALNVMGSDIQEAVVSGFLEGIQSSHRYLQGEFWTVMLKIIKAYGDTDRFDARNEWAVQMCKRMAIAGGDPGTEKVLEEHKKKNRWPRI